MFSLRKMVKQYEDVILPEKEEYPVIRWPELPNIVVNMLNYWLADPRAILSEYCNILHNFSKAHALALARLGFFL